MLKLDQYVFRGKHEDTLGTCLVFKEGKGREGEIRSRPNALSHTHPSQGAYYFLRAKPKGVSCEPVYLLCWFPGRRRRLEHLCTASQKLTMNRVLPKKKEKPSTAAAAAVQQ